MVTVVKMFNLACEIYNGYLKLCFNIFAIIAKVNLNVLLSSHSDASLQRSKLLDFI